MKARASSGISNTFIAMATALKNTNNQMKFVDKRESEYKPQDLIGERGSQMQMPGIQSQMPGIFESHMDKNLIAKTSTLTYSMRKIPVDFNVQV